MAMSAGELIRNVRMSFAQELKLTAGNCSTEQPVLRVRVIGDRASVESVRKYDAVIFHAVRHNSCNILDAAEALSAKGACWMAVSDDKYCAYELKQLRILCNELCLPLIEINSSEYIPTLVDLTYDKLNRAYEEFIEISDILQGLIRMPELYRFYDDILSDYGFFEYSDYCVAVCHFERKIKHCDFQRDITFAAGYIETGLALKNSAAAVMTAGCQVAVIFADIDPDCASSAMMRGLSAIPDELRSKYRVYIGVSDLARGMESLSSLFGYAARTALLQMHRNNEGCPVRVSEHHLNKFMVSLKDRDTIDSLVNDTLFRLAEYDRENDTDYIRFLRVYFRNNCSLQKTAKEMFVHRNSVNYTLRKIESILGRSLSDISTKAELVLVLGFLELSGDEPFSR